MNANAMSAAEFLRRNFVGRRALWLMLALASACSSTTARAADQRTIVSPGALNVSVEGLSGGLLKSWSGGDARSVISSDAPKRIVGVELAPLILEFTLQPSPVIQNWISSFCANQATPKKIVLTQITSTGQVVDSIELDNSVLTKVTFSALGGTARDTATVTLVIQPGYRQKIAPVNQAVTNVGRQTAVTSNFSFSAGALPASRAAKVAAVSIALPSAGSAATGVVVTNLIVTIDGDLTAWSTWRDAVLGFGPQPTVTPTEITADLSFLAPDLRTVLLALHFDGVNIVGMTSSGATTAAGGVEAAPVQIELACNHVTIASVAVGSAATTPSPASTPVPTAAPVASTSPVATPTPAVTLPMVSVATLTPMIMTPLATKSPTLDSTASSASEEQGARDPNLFPRPSGLVRQTFSSRSVPTQNREIASYQSSLDFDALVTNYTNAAKADGWEQLSRSESGTVATQRLMMLEWHKDHTTASVRVYGRAKGSASSVDVVTDILKAGK